MCAPLILRWEKTQTQLSTITTSAPEPKPDLLRLSLKALIHSVNSRPRRHFQTLSHQTPTRSLIMSALSADLQILIGTSGFNAPSTRAKVGPILSAPVLSLDARRRLPQPSSAFHVADGHLPASQGCPVSSPRHLHFSGGQDLPFATHHHPQTVVLAN